MKLFEDSVVLLGILSAEAVAPEVHVVIQVDPNFSDRWREPPYHGEVPMAGWTDHKNTSLVKDFQRTGNTFVRNQETIK